MFFVRGQAETANIDRSHGRLRSLSALSGMDLIVCGSKHRSSCSRQTLGFTFWQRASGDAG
jgi:hypothetical protein